MPALQVIQAFLNQATAQGSRSTVLRPLGWLIAICVGATLGAELEGPKWVVVMFAVSVGLGVLLYLAAYIYCLVNNREDLLRSETYSIQKLAIEKGFIGDSMTGLFSADVPQDKLLGSNQNASDAEEK
jgi:hypothetical protein